MRRYQCIIMLLFLLVASAAAAQERLDGTQTLFCASVEAMDCVPSEACFKGPPEVIGAPQFLKIDFAKQQIIGVKRTTPVLKMEKTDSQFLLQGTELDMGWIFALDRATGKFSATLANKDGAFVIFGACTLLQ